MVWAWRMLGSVPVNHRAVRAGQDAEDLVGVLFDEGGHAGISTQIFLAQETRKGLGGAGPLCFRFRRVTVREARGEGTAAGWHSH